MTTPAQPSNADVPAWRRPAVIGGVIAVAVIAGIVIALLISRPPETAEELEPSASPPPSAPTSPAPSQSEAPASPSTEPTPVAAPDEWTQVATIGDGTARVVGGEIAWGDAGFLAIAKEFEPAGDVGYVEGGLTLWRSANGQTWTEVPSSDLDDAVSSVAALTGAPDGSYMLHAYQTDPEDFSQSLASFHSTDGETWDPIDTGLSGDIFIQGIEEGPAGYLLVGGQGAETNPTLWLSSDAVSWEMVHEFSQDQQFVQLHDGDGGAEGYVVIGRRIDPDSSAYQRFSFASADGREWVEQALPFGPDDETYVWDVAVTSHGGDWLATLGLRDGPTQIWLSTDGLTWSDTSSLDTPELSFATAGLFEEVGTELILSPGATTTWEGTPGTFTSPDAVTWSPIDLGADAYVGELGIGDGVVVMTGTIPGTGEGFTSTAGIWVKSAD